MVDQGLELCLKFVQFKSFFISSNRVLMFCIPFKIILLSKDVVKMVVDIIAFYKHIYLKSFNIPRNSWIFFLFVGG